MSRWADVSWIWITPSLVAIGVVATHYAATAGHWTAAVRPLLAALLVAGVLQGAILLVTRNRVIGGLSAALGVLYLGGQPALALVWLAGAVASAYLRVRRGGIPAPHPAVALILAGSVFLTGLIQVSTSGAVSLRDLVPADHGPILSRTAPLPDIYVLLLDGYARADTLKSTFDFDNEPFLEALRSRSFDVYSQSRTEYDSTARTTLGMLSGTSADLPDTDGLPISQRDSVDREVRRRLAEAPGLSQLHRAGYETVVVLSPVVHVVHRGWDVTIDTGQLTDLEVKFLRESSVGSLFASWVLDQQRDRLEASLAAIVERSYVDRQQVVMAHLMAPHPPFLYSSDGSPMPPPECWPGDCHLYAITPTGLGLTTDEFGRRYTDQIAYLNTLILPALDAILARDPDAVVVVMSDHGSRYSSEDEAERHRNLLAIRSLSHPNLLGTDPTTDRLFERIIDALSAVCI